MPESHDQEKYSVGLLMEEFRALNTSHWERVQLADRRVNFFITLTTSFIAAFGIAKVLESIARATSDNDNTTIIILSVLGILLTYGLFTLARITQRNIVADEIKEQLDNIRKYFIEKDPDIERYLPRKPLSNKYNYYEKRKEKWQNWYSIGTAGLAQTIALLNSVLLWLLLAASPLVNIHVMKVPLSIPLAIACSFLAWWFQYKYTDWRYKKADDKKKQKYTDLTSFASSTGG